MASYRSTSDSFRLAMRVILSLSTAAIILLGSGTMEAGTGEDGAKALFFEPEHTDSKRGDNGACSGAVGLRYWIELEDSNGEVRTVQPSRVFVSGERIRIRFQSNRTGYISILQIPSSGTPAYLFPNPDQGLLDNLIRPDTKKAIPSTGWFRFDSEPGTEKLLVYFSSHQTGLADPSTRLDKIRADEVLTMAAEGGKDLVFEVDADTTYAANQDGEPINLTILLQHR